MRLREKSIRSLILWSVLLLLGALGTSCEKDRTIDESELPAPPGSDAIWFQVSSESLRSTRAAATATEDRVTHLDLLIFDAAGQRVYYESFATPSDRFSLGVRKSYFATDASYDVYLFANCPVEEDLALITDFATLKNRTVNNLYVYATGLIEREDVPSTFLMEGHLQDVVLNASSERLQDKELTVSLYRSAAKIVLNLRAGSANDASGTLEYEFAYDGGITPEYDVERLPVNIPYETHLVPLSAEELKYFTPRLYTPASATTTGLTYGTYGGKTSVTVTLYAYPNDWSMSDSYTSEPRVLVQLPMRTRNTATEEVEIHANNYYSIPLNNLPGGATSLLRNRIYTTNVTFNGLGGTEIDQAVELTDIAFATEKWITHDVVVDTDDNPQFLYLTTNSLRMDNTSEDRSIGFSSSSPIDITVNEVYYYNKFGVKTSLATNTVTVSPSTSGTNGWVVIAGPVPDNNAIRYIEATVRNETGQTETLHIEQYPQVYITNSLGYFSYRSDFEYATGECSTWLHHDPNSGISGGWWNNDKTSVQLQNSTSSTNWSWGGYGKTRNEWLAGDNLFQSKVQRHTANRDEDEYNPITGKGPIGSYGWPLGGGFFDWNASWWSSDPPRENAHIYHVQITSTSRNEGDFEYVIGRPRMRTYTDPDGTTYEGTDDREDNQRVVSPSFMIASQLGLISGAGNTVQFMQQAASHCEKYVEVVYKNRNNRTDNDADLIVYDDWRLPTEAELRIISKFQAGSEVMDIVLDRPNYWSAGGEVWGVGAGYASDGTTEMTGTGVRCVRDCYRDTEEGI